MKRVKGFLRPSVYEETNDGTAENLTEQESPERPFVTETSETSSSPDKFKRPKPSGLGHEYPLRQRISKAPSPIVGRLSETSQRKVKSAPSPLKATSPLKSSGKQLADPQSGECEVCSPRDFVPAKFQTSSNSQHPRKSATRKKKAVAAGSPGSPQSDILLTSNAPLKPNLSPKKRQLNVQEGSIGPSIARNICAEEEEEEASNDVVLQDGPKSCIFPLSEPSTSAKTSPQPSCPVPLSASFQESLFLEKSILTLDDESAAELETIEAVHSNERKKTSKAAPPIVSISPETAVSETEIVIECLPDSQSGVNLDTVSVPKATSDKSPSRKTNLESSLMAEKSSPLIQPNTLSRQQKFQNARKLAAADDQIAPPDPVDMLVKSPKKSCGDASLRKETLVSDSDSPLENRKSKNPAKLSPVSPSEDALTSPTVISCAQATPPSRATFFWRTRRPQPASLPVSTPVSPQQVAPPSQLPVICAAAAASICKLPDIIPFPKSTIGQEHLVEQGYGTPKKSGFERFRNNLHPIDVRITPADPAPPAPTEPYSLDKFSKEIPNSSPAGGRFSRDPNPSLLLGKSPAKPMAIDLGPYAEMFQTGLPGKLKFIDSHTHFCFTLNKLEAQGIRSYDGLKKSFPELFPASYGGSIQVFCHPQHLRAPDQWHERLMEGTENQLWFTYGCHPNWADQWGEDVRQGMMHSMDQARALNRLVAIGEIGLDYSRFNSSEEKQLGQREILATQLQMAVQRNLPIVIHCRNDQGPNGNNQADLDCFEIVQQYVPRAHKIHRHCFTGSYQEATKWRDHFPNVMFGFTPSKDGKNHSARGAIENLPLEAMLLETDAPYFIPSGMRHFPVEMSERSSGNRVAIPGGIALVTAAEISKLKGLPLADVVAATTENTCFIYGIAL